MARNEIDKQQTIEKIDDTKSSLFEKIKLTHIWLETPKKKKKQQNQKTNPRTQSP